LRKADAGDDGGTDTATRTKPRFCPVALPSMAVMAGGGGAAAQTVSDAGAQGAV